MHILSVFLGPILVIHYSNATLGSSCIVTAHNRSACLAFAEAGMLLLFAGLIFTMKLISCTPLLLLVLLLRALIGGVSCAQTRMSTMMCDAISVSELCSP